MLSQTAFVIRAVLMLLVSSLVHAQGFPRLYEYADGTKNPVRNLEIGNPTGLAVSADGRYLFVGNSFGDTYSVIRLGGSGQFLDAERRVGTNSFDCIPADIVVTGDKLFLGCFGSGIAFGFGGPGPDPSRGESDEGHIEVFTKSKFDYPDTFVARLDDVDDQVGTEPFTAIIDLLLSPGGGELYASFIQSHSCGSIFTLDFGTIAIFDTATHQLLDIFPDPSEVCTRPGSLALLRPVAIALNPQTHVLYVSLNAEVPARVAEIPLAANGRSFASDNTFTSINLDVAQPAPCTNDTQSQHPAGLTLSPDGNRLYVTHNPIDFTSGNNRRRVTIIDAASRQVINCVNLPDFNSVDFIGTNPTAPIFTREGDKILIPLLGTDTNVGESIAVLSPSGENFLLNQTVEIPRSGPTDNSTEEAAQPINLILHPTQPFAYVANFRPNNIAVIQTGPVEAMVPELKFVFLVLALVLFGVILHRARRRASV